MERLQIVFSIMGKPKSGKPILHVEAIKDNRVLIRVIHEIEEMEDGDEINLNVIGDSLEIKRGR